MSVFIFDAHVYMDVDLERNYAHKKHGANNNSREDAHWSDSEWLSILVEEIGEVAHELTYDNATDKRMELLRKELVQVAAMACAWIESIDKSTDDRSDWIDIDKVSY